MPLSLSWVSRSDLGTLTGAEVAGRPLALVGDALLSGYYLNELLLHLLHRHDPQPEIFDAYASTIRRLAVDGEVAAALREFEIELLRQAGYALEFEREALTQDALEPSARYEYRVAQGPVSVHEREGPLIFSGRELGAIAGRRFDDPTVLAAAGRLLRAVIAYHLDGRELKSRRILRDIRRSAGPTKP